MGLTVSVGGVFVSNWDLKAPDMEKCLGSDKLKLSHKLPVLVQDPGRQWGGMGSSACLGSDLLWAIPHLCSYSG